MKKFSVVFLTKELVNSLYTIQKLNNSSPVTHYSSVSLDCQYFDREKEKFRVIKSNKVVDPNKEVIVVLSNLAVRRDRRKQKIAQKLLQACENYIRVSDLHTV